MKKRQIIPTAFCFSKSKVRAFVLGADPTNFSKGNQRVELTKVFGIGDGDPRYFKDILENLKLVGLSLENIYVQNLIGEYLSEETSKNKYWNEKAEKHIPNLKLEFDKIDKTKKVPVLITAEEIYKTLINQKTESIKVAEFYKNSNSIPIEPLSNKLERPLIPFYRHQNYSLKKHEWRNYKDRVSQII